MTRRPSLRGHGVDWADYDNDGQPDFVDALANQGYGLFRTTRLFERFRSTGLARLVSALRLGARFSDLTTTAEDIFVAQGHVDG